MADVRVAGPDRIGEPARLDDGRRLSERVAPADEFPDFLTLPAHEPID